MVDSLRGQSAWCRGAGAGPSGAGPEEARSGWDSPVPLTTSVYVEAGRGLSPECILDSFGELFKKKYP